MSRDPTKGWSASRGEDALAGDRAPADPLALFDDWFTAARDASLIEPTAMTLATTDPMGRPSARMVLLKGFDSDGFRFYTNLESRKARELAANPNAALVFWWDQLERQVRIEGEVAEVPAEDSDAYFASRPRGSQLGAHASPQSRVILARQDLEKAVDQVTEHFANRAVPRPGHWGGYCLTPRIIEFWQGRQSRLHDRLRYRHREDGWQCERLAP